MIKYMVLSLRYFITNKVKELKKFFSLFLCAVMLFAFTGCLADPEPEVTTEPVNKTTGELPVSGIEGAFKFDEYSDHVVLTEYVGTSTVLNIPDTIKGKPVTDFGTIFSNNLTIVSCTVGKNCKDIPDNAFKNCYNLQNVQIRDGVESIGCNAFFGCHSLKLVNIPQSVKSIDDEAFKYCINLLIYGVRGSEAEKFVDKFNSVYFRDVNEVITTTLDSTSKTVTGDEIPVEETSTMQ